ncbi:MAG: hypothetical protein HY903_05965 [Deltaproteobacteria bacterium]|nr:hypothetical protein [Deltaproteobacteria bacterium]
MRAGWSMSGKAVVGLLLVAAGAACGGEGSTAPQGSSKTVKGTIAYGGSEVGMLIVSVGTNPAPTCPNDEPEVYKMVNNPGFPYAYMFTNLKGGDYFVYGFYDIDGNAGFPPCPQADDVCGKNATPVLVDDANPTAVIDVTLDLPGCVQ